MKSFSVGSIVRSKNAFLIFLYWCVLAAWAAFYEGFGGSLPPGARYWLDRFGLNEVFRSGWSIFGLSVSILYCLAASIQELRVLISSDPLALVRSHSGGLGEVRLDLAAPAERKDLIPVFEEWLEEWFPVVSRKGSTVIGTSDTWATFGRALLFAGLTLLLVSLGVREFTMYQGRLVMEPGRRGAVIETLRGNPPSTWEPYRLNHQEVRGYYSPDFLVIGHTVPERTQEARLEFYREGHKEGDLHIRAGQPRFYEGLEYHLRQMIRQEETVGVNLLVEDTRNRYFQRFYYAELGRPYVLQGGFFVISKLERKSERLGNSVQIEYDRDGKTDRFWIFQNFPDADPTKREGSRHFFYLEDVQSRRQADVLITRDPARIPLRVGVILFLLGAILGLLRPVQGVRVSPHEGTWMITGYAPVPVTFGSRFQRAVNDLKERIFGG